MQNFDYKQWKFENHLDILGKNFADEQPQFFMSSFYHEGKYIMQSKN
jgi:hypothetical protein